MLSATEFYAAQGSQLSQTFVSKSKSNRNGHDVPSMLGISWNETF